MLPPHYTTGAFASTPNRAGHLTHRFKQLPMSPAAAHFARIDAAQGTLHRQRRAPETPRRAELALAWLGQLAGDGRHVRVVALQIGDQIPQTEAGHDGQVVVQLRLPARVQLDAAPLLYKAIERGRVAPGKALPGQRHHAAHLRRHKARTRRRQATKVTDFPSPPHPVIRTASH